MLCPMAHNVEDAQRITGGGRGARAALAQIDAAVAAAASRNAVSRDQALRTLGEVEASVVDPALAQRTAALVNEAAVSYRGDALVDRGRYLDALLDIRALLIGR